MTAGTFLALREARDTLSDVVDRAERQHERIIITRHGKPAAVVLGIEDIDGLEETLAILSDPVGSSELIESIAESDRGHGVVRLTKDQALAKLVRAGQRGS